MRKDVGDHDSKTVVVVPVVRVVPVAVRAARVVLVVVPRAATQHVQVSTTGPRTEPSARWSLCAHSLFNPAPQQIAQFFDHPRDMVVLPLGQPLPANGEA